MAHLEGAMKMENKEYESGDDYYQENYGNKWKPTHTAEK
jgi:hypothetical protein